MQQAVVAREDKRFLEHTGVDVQGVFRAFFQTYVRGGDQQGGSTLTQQYVKNVLSTQAREDDDPIAEYHATEDTVARKLREMLISVLKGTFSMVSGMMVKHSPEAAVVKTPTATIGVRGTEFAIEVD